jgi:hypothetical protein
VWERAHTQGGARVGVGAACGGAALLRWRTRESCTEESGGAH